MDTHLSARIGVDLGGTKIEAIILNADGTIVQRERCATPKDDYAATLNAVASLVDKLANQAKIPQGIPIGIGAPGAISLKTGKMMNCNSTCLNHQPLTEDLQNLTRRQVRVANDADCFALSEASDGAASEEHLVLGIILGTGVGGGIVSNKRLLPGVNAISGEWGHNTLPINDLQHDVPQALIAQSPTCFCGRKNCVETWLAGPSFERHFEQISNKKLKVPDILNLVRAGDHKAHEWFECYLELLALGLSNVINILDPGAIVFGGGVSNIPELYQRLPNILPKYVFSDTLHTKLVPATFGDSSGVRGAAWLWQADEIKPLLANHSQKI